MNCHLCLCFLSCLGLLGFQLFLSRCFNLVVRLTKVRTANKVGSSGLLDFHKEGFGEIREESACAGASVPRR